MSSQDLIRLRVSVQRHGVPEVKLVWPCVRSHDLTVSRFLSQINEVMPLESGEWGLEDYVVELADGTGGSYECLHFQPVPYILKNDDHVLIRCLHSEDVKRRRLSGRHQISSDGRHLVDGLVFGRPWLRTPHDRPALELPPRKRARTARDGGGSYDFDDQDDLYEAPPPRLFPERAEQGPSDDDAYTERSDDSEEWQDEEHDEGSDDSSSEDGDEVAEELRYLRNENLTVGHEIPTNNAKNSALDDQAIGARAQTADGLDLGALDGIVALQAAFPRAPVVAIEAELLRQHKDLREAYDALSHSHEPALRFNEMMQNAIVELLFPGQVSSSGSPEGDPIRQRSSPSRPLIQVVESSDKMEDAAGALVSASSNVGREQGRHNTSLPQTRPVSTTEENSAGNTDNVEDAAEAIDDSDETSDGTDSSSNSASSSDEDESSSDDSDSDSDSSDDDIGVRIDRQSSDDESSSDDSESDSDSSDDDRGASGGGKVAQKQLLVGGQGEAKVPSGTPAAPSGRTRTQKRNARRRRSMARALTENRSQQEDEALALEARKQQLLLQVDESMEVAGESQNAPVKKVQVNQGDSSAGHRKNGNVSDATPDRRRSRVDMGAGRRFVFGSLGLKAPKTRADEEKIKQRLMKDVRPLHNMRLAEDEKAGGGPPTAAGGDADDWRQQVTYRAVECSHPSMTLSEPPFPFEQRWDPQQRGRAYRKQKRSSQDLFQEYYGEDDSGLYMEEDVGKTKRARTLVGDPFGVDVPGEDKAAPTKMPSSETKGRTAAAQVDDVPPLPADVDSLATLEAGQTEEGMVITWKQIAMSKATRWQPTVVQQTATVLGGSDDRKLRVLLAVRDREDRSKAYDEAGQRIYDKFEMPDADSDDEGEDDGERTVAWAEMTEPKVVRMPQEEKQV